MATGGFAEFLQEKKFLLEFNYSIFVIKLCFDHIVHIC